MQKHLSWIPILFILWHIESCWNTKGFSGADSPFIWGKLFDKPYKNLLTDVAQIQ